MATVLKTVDCKRSVSSNLTVSAKQLRKVGRAARQQIANLSFSNGWIGSTPILSANNNMVDSTGVRPGFINLGEWSDGLQRKGS